MTKQTLKDRVVAFLKGGDESKLSRFEAKLGKYLDKQISMRKESIETLKEKITDAKEVMGEAVINVDTSRIGNTDSTESYVSSYVKNISEKLSVVEQFEADIKAQEEEIARFEKLREVIYPTESVQPE